MRSACATKGTRWFCVGVNTLQPRTLRVLYLVPSFVVLNMLSSVAGAMMRPLAVRKAKVTYPTGDPSFSVMQAFPAAFTAEEADPWLMLDHFGPSKSKGKETGPDDFPIGWHPHRGMDILTYMGKHLLCSSITLSPYLPFKNLTCLCLWCFLSTVEGKVRHADSMGNRGAWLVQRGEVMAAHGAVLAHPFSCVTGACSITPFAASADQCLCSRNGIVQRCSHFRVSPASCCLLASHRDGGHARHAVDFGGQRHRACRGGRHACWAGRSRLPDL